MTAKTDAQLESLAALMEHCSKRIYTANAVVFKAGDQAESLYYIISGSLVTVGEDYSGREITLCYHNPDKFVGEMGLFDKRPRNALVRANSGAELGEVSYSEFRSLSAQYPSLMLAVMAQITDQLRASCRKICDLVFLDVNSRIAHTLLDLCGEPAALNHPQGRQLRITRREIARYVGCSREVVGKALKDFQQRGLVNVSGKTIVIFHGSWEELLSRSHQLTKKSL